MEIDVDWVIDGDTFQSANARIRLFGVNTPERGEPCFTEATERLRQVAGDSVRVEFGPRQRQAVERVFPRLKGQRSLNHITVRKWRKVTNHCYQSLIALQARLTCHSSLG